MRAKRGEVQVQGSFSKRFSQRKSMHVTRVAFSHCRRYENQNKPVSAFVMCGIFCQFCSQAQADGTNAATSRLSQKVKQFLMNRGPTNFNASEICIPNWKADFFASVLWLQGKEVACQPVEDDNGNILLWNGDIYGGLKIPDDQSDTSYLSKALQVAANSSSQGKISSIFGSIEGPWSFIYWVAATRELWFGRDPLGRHSLLWSISPENITIASAGERSLDFKEVPATGIFVVKFEDIKFNLKLFKWKETASSDILQSFGDIKINSEVLDYRNYSTSNLTAPGPDDPFEALICQLGHLQLTFETTKFFQSLLCDNEVKSRVEKLIEELKTAVEIRSNTQPPSCKNCLSKNLMTGCNHSKVAVLFSGGLDSSVIAVLAHLSVPEEHSIDLINVAFTYSQPVPSGKSKAQPIPKEEGCITTDSKFQTPDRITGKATFSELEAMFPQRQWNFVEVNVTKEELQEFRDKAIADLIYPLNSILDDSLGCALWFAARGKGIKHSSVDLKEEMDYISPANVLLLGMGADELLGGYSKYRKTFAINQDWHSIAELLAHDLAVIPYRNLGRDDRVVCDSGRQARFPFLAENFVRFVTNLPAHLRTAPHDFLPNGVGEKIILRLAAFTLGLSVAAVAPKRALQFGSKIAGLEGKKEVGHKVCARLLL